MLKKGDHEYEENDLGVGFGLIYWHSQGPKRWRIFGPLAHFPIFILGGQYH